MQNAIDKIRACKHAKQIIFSLRKALSCDYYKKNKYDESNSVIHFLHELAAASFIEAPVFRAYRQVGDAISKLTPKASQFVDFYHFSRQAAKRAGVIENDISFGYLAKYFSLAIGSLVSMAWFRPIKTLFHLADYDPHGRLENTSGAFFEEEFEGEKKRYSLRAFITATPSVNDALSPEALALLQAMENRNLEDKVTTSPTMWIYINLQNMASPSEGIRAREILEAQKSYPHAFRPISIAADTHLYLHPDHREPFDEKFLETLIASLIRPTNFSYEDRMGAQDSGYFFPDPDWVEILPEIARAAYRLVTECGGEKFSPYERKIALHELTHLGIIRWHMLRSLEESGGRALFSIACKEGIDRGGAKNGLLLWACSPEFPERDLFAFFHGRPLLTRYRLPRKSRIDLVLKTMEMIPKGALAQFLHGIEEEAALYSKSFTITGTV
jgi:hypothetical protein